MPNTGCNIIDNKKLKTFIKENIEYVDSNYRLWSVELNDKGKVVKDEDIDTLEPSAEVGYYYRKNDNDFVKIRTPKAFAKSFCDNYKQL